ncbi:long-chain acyl-CoA synthetase [Lachnospiraceae bacterium PF1-21]|uniref:class I adenylate-forming enzyme family protein n=1 Tax=Ohessyouella blattaphilus TaxID=2949333 RepID=UPI003E1D0E97
MYSGTELWNRETTIELSDIKLNSGEVIETYQGLPQNLYEALVSTAAKNPKKIALVDNYDKKITYGEFKVKVDDFASWLKYERNIKRGDYVAVLLYNSIEFCVAFMALVKLGGITVPLPTKYQEPEIKSLVAKADIKCIILNQEFEKWFAESLIPLVVVTDSKTEDGLFKYRSEHLMKQISLETYEDVALLMFTSGTTSQSKGVPLKNYNIMHAVATYQKTLKISERDISIIPIPIYHITGLVALLGLFVYVGGTLYIHKYFQAKRVLSCVKNSNVTFLHASPTVFSLILAEATYFPELPSLEKLACGSGNMPKEKIGEINKWLPHCAFHTVYGLTETTSPAAIFPRDVARSEYIGSSGIPIPGTHFKIMDEEKRMLSCGKVGEIWISGTVVMTAYLDVDSASLEGGWLATGDLGYFNDKGYLFVVDRKKDMINRGGEKIWSFDVENELYKIEGVLEAAVIGVPDDIYGEVVAAVIVKEENIKYTADDIKAALKGKIAKYKIPERILIRESIPMTPNGKIDKKNIRKLFV